MVRHFYKGENEVLAKLVLNDEKDKNNDEETLRSFLRIFPKGLCTLLYTVTYENYFFMFKWIKIANSF